MSETFFDPLIAMFPELAMAKAPIAPVRIGVDRETGKVIMGWDHVQQSMATIFATPFHERVLRRYVGSFVPHILGESAVPTIITRFYWAMISAIDLWEPGYRIKQILFQGKAVQAALGTSAKTKGTDELRAGHAYFKHTGQYLPRGHLGDPTPDAQKGAGFVGRGNIWDTVGG